MSEDELKNAGFRPKKTRARSSRSSKTQPKPISGYAYEWAVQRGYPWRSVTDEAWDTVMFTPDGSEKFVGERRIDGVLCHVWYAPSREVSSWRGTGAYIAQTSHMTRASK